MRNDPNSGATQTGENDQGWVNRDDWYTTHTLQGLVQPFLAATQIVELGNSLDLISGTQGWDQAYAQDRQKTKKPNPLLGNLTATPGIALWDCLTHKGGIKF